MTTLYLSVSGDSHPEVHRAWDWVTKPLLLEQKLRDRWQRELAQLEAA